MPRPLHTHFRTLRRITGVVVSTGMDRTAVVAVQRLYIHPLTRKIMKHVSKHFCHDNHEICGVGDKVQIQFWGTMSKKKRFVVVDLLHRQPQLHGEPFPMSKLAKPPTAEELLAQAEAFARRQAEDAAKAAKAAETKAAASSSKSTSSSSPAPPPTKTPAEELR
jgi:small subunit ribosomal protein S17